MNKYWDKNIKNLPSLWKVQVLDDDLHCLK